MKICYCLSSFLCFIAILSLEEWLFLLLSLYLSDSNSGIMLLTWDNRFLGDQSVSQSDLAFIKHT